MPSYVAMLRGVNVSGRNRLPMAELREAMDPLPVTDVQTYVQSGNVVFASAQDGNAVAAMMATLLAETFGLDVPVVVRTGADLERILAAEPFCGAGIDAAKLHITFLAEPPAPARLEALDPDAGGPDQFVIKGREVYLHCPHGYGTTKLNNAFFEKKLAQVATTRNLKTVTRLAELSADLESS